MPWEFRHDLTGPPGKTPGLGAANSTLPAIADSASTTATYAAVYKAPAGVTVGEGTYTAVSISIRHTRGALSSTARTSVLVPYGTRSSPSRTSFSSEGGTSRSDPIALYGYWANRVLYLAVSGGVAIGSAAYHAATILQAVGTLAAAPTTGTRPGGTSPTSDTDTIYRRGSTTPTRPTGGTTSATALPTGWSRTDPGATATENVYVATRTRNFNINGDFTGATAWSAVSLHEAATGGGASSRTRTFYQRGSTAPAAPSSTAFGAYTSPGGGWSTSDPGATATQGVYQVTLTQSFSSSTQSSSTFTGNSWSAVSLHEAATGTTSLAAFTRTFTVGGTTGYNTGFSSGRFGFDSADAASIPGNSLIPRAYYDPTRGDLGADATGTGYRIFWIAFNATWAQINMHSFHSRFRPSFYDDVRNNMTLTIRNNTRNISASSTGFRSDTEDPYEWTTTDFAALFAGSRTNDSMTYTLSYVP